ncbi:hypothetical protein FZEAL_7059 [Fusarium zealandicum]|uniref:DNA mismatch repair protein HSM3 N-terminal domain-containing protein n=1 Tax=Fusarium zealandicum TaxID=1053134 RepID=A0A8H4UHA3_9HYPO|nr:hypothetical protein FZEAL_7059 [Fusarium zealandicum]
MSERIVPMEDDSGNRNLPISGLSELQTHLEELVDDESIPFNAKLFDDVELQLTETNIPPLLPTLLPPLTTILKQTTQDPTPLLSLTIKLLSPVPFSRCLTIADPPSLLAALRSPLPGANLLALAIIHKAASTPADAAILSTIPDVVEELVRRWLDSADVGVGGRAARVLGDVLETDCEVIVAGEGVNGVSDSAMTNGIAGTELVKRRVPGHGRIWRLIFTNRQFVHLITSICRPETINRQATLAQGRLLRILPRLAVLDLRAMSTTPYPELLPLPSSIPEQIGHGLLQWAALAMVDNTDVLMHLSVIDFFETFVSIIRIAGNLAEKDGIVRALVGTAAQEDEQLTAALRGLPDRTVEEEAEPLARFIGGLLG